MTQEITPVSGVPEPRKPVVIQEKAQVTDPEKFKKILKVDESDESKERNRRNRARQEEEVEEEGEIEKTSTPPSDPKAFGSLLSTSSESSSIFDVEGGKTLSYASSAPMEEAAETDPFSLYSSSKTPDASKPSPSFNMENDRSSITISMDDTKKVSSKGGASSSSDSQKEAGNTPLPEIVIKAPKKTKKAPPTAPPEASLEPTPSKKETKKIQTEELASKQKEEEVREVSNKEDVKQKGQKEVQETASPLPIETPKEIQSGKKSDATPIVAETHTVDSSDEVLIQAPQKGEEPLMQQHKKQKEEEYRGAPLVEGASSSLMQNSSLGISAAQAPAYTRLPSETFELFQKMVGLMTIEQTKGISKTTVTLNMPGSVFDKCQIQIDHYDTAPHSFNVQLFGNAQAVAHFNTNLNDLAAAFQQSRLPFEVNLQRPSLLSDSDKDKHLIKRKGKAGGEKEGGQEGPP